MENKIISHRRLVFPTNVKKTKGKQGVKAEITLKLIFWNIISNNKFVNVHVCMWTYVFVYGIYVYNLIWDGCTIMSSFYLGTFTQIPLVMDLSNHHRRQLVLLLDNYIGYIKLKHVSHNFHYLKSSGLFNLLQEALQKPKDIRVWFNLL